MSSIRNLLLLSIVAVAGGCESRFQNACRQDSFFCAHPTAWESSLNPLPTERVFRLYVLDQRISMPPNSVFSRELGQRGEESLSILEGHLAENPADRDGLFYQPILISVVEFGYDFCRSPHYARIQSALASPPFHRRYDPKAERARVRRFCQSDLGRPPHEAPTGLG